MILILAWKFWWHKWENRKSAAVQDSAHFVFIAFWSQLHTWAGIPPGKRGTMYLLICIKELLKLFARWHTHTHTHTHTHAYIYTGCPRRNVPDFGRVFLVLKYTDITQNTYVQSWTVMEIMAREKCGLLAGPRTVPVSWQVLTMFILEYGVRLQKVSSH